MKFISIFLERPRILFLTLAFILLSGILSLRSVPIQENPELAERWGNVGVFYPGASPERIETLVVNDLEMKLNGTNIKSKNSIHLHNKLYHYMSNYKSAYNQGVL